MNKIYTILLPLVLLAGCTTNTPPTNAHIPSWVINPNVPGYITVVGSAPGQKENNENYQLTAAKLNAQAELAKRAGTYVDHLTVVEHSVVDEKIKTTLDYNTKQVSKQGLELNSAEILQQWLESTGTLYILYGIEEQL